MATAPHSPLPWKYEYNAGNAWSLYIDPDKDGLYIELGQVNKVEDIRFACHAVNNHTALVKALGDLVAHAERQGLINGPHPAWDKARQALASAWV